MSRKKGFVAISDFHGIEYPLDKVEKYYINEYDRVYILGDATDRGEDNLGTGGIELLERIMYLTKKYPEQVRYIPVQDSLELYDIDTKEDLEKLFLRQNNI